MPINKYIKCVYVCIYVCVQECVVHVSSMCIIIKCSHAICINGCYFCHRARSCRTEAYMEETVWNLNKVRTSVIIFHKSQTKLVNNMVNYMRICTRL